MKVGNGPALAARQPGEMHEAGHVPADQNIRAGFQNVIQLQRAHAARDMRKGDRKGASESTALLGLSKCGNRHTLDGFQQAQGGLTTPGTSAMTGSVKGDPGSGLKPTGPFLDVEPIENEIHDLPSPDRKRVNSGLRAVFKLERISVKIHRRTGTRGNDHG